MLIHNDDAWRHHSGARPTLTALQAMVQSSPRQTAGFVATLKAARLITAEKDPDDARVKCLRATPSLVAEIGRPGRLFVPAMDSLWRRQPGCAEAPADPEQLGELVYRSAVHVLGNGLVTEPFQRIFQLTGRDCGYPLPLALVGAHYAATVPGASPAVSLSLRDLAERWCVYQTHFSNLLREAEADGWFRTEVRHLAQLDPSLLAEFELWPDCHMIFYDDIASAIRTESSPAEVGPDHGLACVPTVPEIPTGGTAL